MSLNIVDLYPGYGSLFLASLPVHNYAGYVNDKALFNRLTKNMLGPFKEIESTAYFDAVSARSRVTSTNTSAPSKKPSETAIEFPSEEGEASDEDSSSHSKSKKSKKIRKASEPSVPSKKAKKTTASTSELPESQPTSETPAYESDSELTTKLPKAKVPFGATRSVY